MFDRQNWSRLFASIFVLTVVSAFAIAAIGPRYFPSMFTTAAAPQGSASVIQTTEPAAPVTIGTCDTAGPIEVESTGGTTTPTAYATLKAAFDAINAGTHTDSINIDVCGNTTESASAILNSGAVAPASYTAVTIRPVGSGRVIEGTINGAVIKLNGADNVTIDGRQGGVGSARDLTVQNNSSLTATAAIWLASVAAGNGVSNSVIRNLELAGGADQRTSAVVTAGIIMSGTTISVTSNGVDNDNNQFIANRIIRVRYGIVTRGTTTDLNVSPVVTDNIIGPESFGPDQIGKTGIFMQADTGAIVSRNVVQNVGVLISDVAAGADRNGIAIGTESWSATDTTSLTSLGYTVTRNIVNNIIEEKTFSSAGIKIGTTQSGSATNNLIANNFISNVRANATSGDQFVGIGIGAGNGDRVVFNSISITGDVDPGASTSAATYGNAIRIPGANGTNNANFVVQNNSIYLDVTSNTETIHYYAITLNGAAYSFGTGGLNYNNYYINAANAQLRTGGLGTATTGSPGTEFQTLANWQAALTVPQDANSIQADPTYFSNTSDLHIQSVSPNINAGTAITGVAEDFDAQVRPNGPNPDIGADEFYTGAGTVQFSSSTASATETAGTLTLTVTRAGGANGAASVDYSTGGGTATGGVACGAGVDYVTTSGTLNWADLDVAPKQITVPLCADGTLERAETFNVTLSNPMTATLGTPSVATATIFDGGTTFSGPVNVGSGETITSLTNPGGIFDAINNGLAAGPVTINITSDLTGESGSIPLNQVAGSFSVLIKPSGAARSISSTVGAVAVIKLNEADNVTIDGSLNGGSDRSLSITNTGQNASTSVIWLGGSANGAQNNTIKNLNLSGGFDQSTGSVFNFAIIASSSTAILTGGTDLDNNVYTNNFIKKVSVGIISIGGLASNMNQNTVISNNLIGPASFGSDQISTLGILAFNENSMQIVDNEIRTIGDLATTGGSSGRDHAGISLCTGNAAWSATTSPGAVGNMTNALVARNRIHDIIERATFSAVGIVENCPKAAATNNTIANNFIYNIQANGTAGDHALGIGISQGNGDSFVYNSINLTGDLDPGAATTSSHSSTGIFIGNSTAANVPVNVTVKNNIVATDVTSNTATLLHSAITIPSAAFVWGTGGSDFNDWYANPSSAQTRVGAFGTGAAGTTFHATLAAWQAATTQDANSESVDPLWVSATDLHLTAGSTLIGQGTPVAVTNDIDGQTRDATTPDIGADEFIVSAPGTLAFSSATYSVGEAGPTVTLTVNRTGGSDGAVNVDYSLGGGTATGGAACGGAVDYVNAGGTLMFANGETTKTFDVPICNDAVFEGDETFNATLSNATGGATIGSPNPATVTITDNEGQPTVQFSSATYTITEGLVDSGVNPVATITVTLSGPSQSAASVDFATVAGGTATGGASCTAGIDFINTSGTLNFVAGDVSETFQVTTCPDAIDETDETVNLALSNPIGTTLGTPNTAVLTIIDNEGPAAPVTVTATAGTTGPTPYNTVKEAFDAINAGTHQGAITVSINQNTTETASAILNASGGAAAYTSVLVRPTATVTVSGSIVGAIIKLNGADNVTIDGRIGGTGTGRDLSVVNNQSSAATAAIWVASAGVGAGATGNVIRNLELACGANQSTGALATYGIIMSGATVTLTANGDDNDNNSFIANRVIRARYGIATRGNPANLNLSTVVTDNIIGPAAFGADQIGKAGIFLQADSGAVISRNTVQFVGGLFGNTTAGADRVGIAAGVENWASAPTTLAGAGYTITRNVIHDIIEERTFSALGILASVTNGASPTNNLIANNFIYNVNANATSPDAAVGIGIGAGNGDRVVFNSVRMAGDSDPTAAATTPTQTNVNLRVANTPTNLTVKNNSLYNDMFSSSAPALLSANIQLPAANFAFGTGGLNNNNYYFPVANTTARTGAIGTLSLATTFHATLANWQAAVAPQDANSIQADPQYVSPTDLHIALVSPNVNAGATGTGVVNDIDFQVRDAMPDIGADEPNGATAPANDIAATAIITPAPGSVLINGTATTPQARFYNAGSATQTGVSVQFTITGPGGYNYSNMQTIATIGSDESVTVTFATAPTFTMAGTYLMTATVLTPDSNSSNDSVSGSFTVINPLSGTYTVGTGGNFTSLTNPGGLFDLINTAGVTGNVTAEIISDLTAETGAVALNQLSGGFGLTIKPTGAARVISGTSAASSGLIILHAADNVTIDGSLSGGTDRSLTITNNQATTGIVIWMRSITGNGATNNTVKNTILNGAPGPNSTTVAGILTGSSVTLGGDAEAPNSNNTIQNNSIYRVQNSCYLRGGLVAANFDQNWVVTGNDFGSADFNDNNIFRGMLIGNAANFTITNNNVQGIRSTATTTAAMSGIQLALLLSNGTVTGNRITNIKNVSTTGTGAHGISIIATSTASNVTIANNFVSDVAANGSATIASNGHGIAFLSLAPGGSGYNLYHNSVNLNTNQTTAQTSAAMFITSTFNVAGAINARNNIFSNTETTGTRYGVYSLAPATVFAAIDYNDYFAQNVGFIGGLARPTLADWQTGTGQDANSKAVDPLFVSPTDLHLQPFSTLRNMGVAGTGITVDIDGQPRDAMPDIGADELIGPIPMPGSLQFSSATYSVGENGPVATITVTRTGGSEGTVTVQYATSNGTATGGATCSAGVDYQNTSGVLTFLNGETSKTFDVPICEDSVDELDETVNLALSNPTGGAVLGTPNTAVLTIVDNDMMPGFLSINDVRLFEGNSGATNAVFTVTYTGPALPVSVQFATANGTATQGVDYLPTSGTLNFNAPPSPEGIPSQTRTITVVVNGDTVKEANETFFVNLSNPNGASITDGQGVGIIVDEDRPYVADFDLDRVADFSVFRPSEGVWYVRPSAGSTANVTPFGVSTDIPVPGDYDGDARTDIAVFRPSTGEWFRLPSSTGVPLISSWGTTGDKPVQGDYDGDGKTDLAVYRPSTGTWWVLRSSNGTSTTTSFGISTDRPVQGDYDGDAKTDVAVYRDGTWFILRSSDGSVQIRSWGVAADKPVSGDFDGDGSYDLAIYRDGVWWILRSLTASPTVVPWGTTTDIPVPADYDGDGTTDLAVFRPSTGDWFVIRSSTSVSFGIHWGLNGDVPIPAAYLPQ